MQGTEVSKRTILFATFWVGVHSLLKGFFPLIGKEYGLNVTEIIASAFAMVVLWTPIYRSIWLDKKLGITAPKKGESENEEEQCGKEV